jgi:biopolymer transport protein ExbD
MEIPSSRSKRRARIEIVPLIDIMFFLLATFVMVSLSMVKSRGISVVLPQASTGQPQEQPDHVSVSVTENGQLYLDKRELSMGELVESLQGLKTGNPDLRVRINGDQNARLGLAISVLDEVRKLGINKIAFETRAATGR